MRIDCDDAQKKWRGHYLRSPQLRRRALSIGCCLAIAGVCVWRYHNPAVTRFDEAASLDDVRRHPRRPIVYSHRGAGAPGGEPDGSIAALRALTKARQWSTRNSVLFSYSFFFPFSFFPAVSRRD